MGAILTSAQRRGIYLVVDRLRLIQDSWDKQVTTSDIEHLSGHLRELLSVGAYNRAWKLIEPVQPMRASTVVAPAIEDLAPKNKYNWSRIAFAQTAGLAIPGAHLWMPLMLMKDAEIAGENTASPKVIDQGRVEFFQTTRAADSTFGPLPTSQVRMYGAIMSGLIDQERVSLGPSSCYKRYTLKKFLDSVCLIHMGRPFNRVELVKLYANKYGGVHIEWNESGGDHRAMAEAGMGVTISQRNPVLYELLSIGQIIANSTDTQLLRQAAHAVGIG